MVKDNVLKIIHRMLFLALLFWLLLVLQFNSFTPIFCDAFVLLNRPLESRPSYGGNDNDLDRERVVFTGNAVPFDFGNFRDVGSSLHLLPNNDEFSAQSRRSDQNKIDDETTEPNDKRQTSNESKSDEKNINTIFRIAASSDGKIPELEKDTSDNISSYMTKTSDRIGAIYNAINNQRLNSLSIMDDMQNNATTIQTLTESLQNSGFMPLSQRDLDLCAALNPGYLLRLSIAPDLEKLDPGVCREFYPNSATSSRKPLFDGRVLIFRRGYSKEVTRGRLLLPKLDYLQSSIVQRTASKVSRLISNSAISNAITNSSQSFQKSIQATLDAWQDKFKDPDEIPEAEAKDDLESEISTGKKIKNTASRIVKRPLRKGVDMLKNATSATGSSLNATLVERKKKMFERYTSAGTGSSVGSVRRRAKFVDPNSLDPDDELNSFLVREIDYDDDDGEGLDSKENAFTYGYGFVDDLDDSSDLSQSQTQLPIRLLKRVSIANLVSFLSDGGRRRLIKSLFAESELVEPRYEEVVVIWRPLPEPMKKKKALFVPPPLPKFVYEILEIVGAENKPPQPPLPEKEPDQLPIEIRTFDRVPMANLLAVLPKTKLIFRPADALLFDLVNVFSLLAVLASQKFDSPQLDLIALASVTLWVARTFFRYSNKIARYDLLVNKFLTQKISYRNKGALKYITNEAAVQRARRASLVHDWLVEDFARINREDLDMDAVIQLGSFEVNKRLPFGYPVFVDVQAALDDLVELGLIQFNDGGRLKKVEIGDRAIDALAQLWNGIFRKI